MSHKCPRFTTFTAGDRTVCVSVKRLSVRTLCDAYHKECASHSSSILDRSPQRSSKGTNFSRTSFVKRLDVTK